MEQTIQDFIKGEFARRLALNGVLVIYDPSRRYRTLASELGGGKVTFVDASESSIESREAAMAAFVAMGKSGGKQKQLLVYVPVACPLDDEARQRDPFAVYAAAGDYFPNNAGDEYKSLCLKFRPDQMTEITRIFADNDSPEFAVVNAVGGGMGWPTLKGRLGVDSAREMILALLTPTDRQKADLQVDDSWVGEAKELFDATLKFTPKTKGKTLNSIGEELWRYLLFSEFAFDLPNGLPAGLADVPHAPAEAQPLVLHLCDALRDSRTNMLVYVDQASRVEQELNLAAVCKGLSELGSRDTFPFEERSYFAKAVETLKAKDYDAISRLTGEHMDQVWSHRGENLSQWQLVHAASDLMRACDDLGRELPEHVGSLAALLDFYTERLSEADRLQREFEQTERDLLRNRPEQIDDILMPVRSAYRTLVENVQAAFLKQLAAGGWPPEGRISNGDVFDKFVAPILQENGKKVAVLLIDALRYELGVELTQQLAGSAQVDLKPAYALLPSITSVGMAGHLPAAGAKLRLKKKADGMVVAYGETELPQVTQRMAVLEGVYGDRFLQKPLVDFLKDKAKIPRTVDLMVLRTTAIDQQLENAPEMSLKSLLETLKYIGAAVAKLGKAGFSDVFIVADHGFYLNTARGAGDVCARPVGTWLSLHDRILLGEGNADAANAVFAAERLGIRGDFAKVAVPLAMVPYRDGLWYFHGGISLQEAVVPVIHVQPKVERNAGEKSVPHVSLSYKRAGGKVTTRLPMIDIVVEDELQLFEGDNSFDVLLEAFDREKRVVGEAKIGGYVNPATHAITLKPGMAINVPLRMDDLFEGRFTVKLSNPVTGAEYAKLDLTTDYTV